MTVDAIVVTQVDRDRAADFLEAWEPGPEMTVVKLARSFATHRTEAVAALEARVRELEGMIDQISGINEQMLVEVAAARKALHGPRKG